MPQYYRETWTIASEPASPAGRAYSRQFYEAVVTRCELLNMSITKLAGKVGLGGKIMQGFGDGTHCPTVRRVLEISQELEENFCPRFPVRFTGEPVQELLLREPSALGSRVQHLANLLTHGVQGRLAERIGISVSTVRYLITQHGWPPGTPETKLFEALPTLSQAWLRRGEGPIFADGKVPACYCYEPRRALTGPSRQARDESEFLPPIPQSATTQLAEQVSWRYPRPGEPTQPLPTEATMMLTEAYPEWRLLRGYDVTDLAAPTPALLQSLSERLRLLAKRGVSLTSKQIMELASFLDLVQPEVFTGAAAGLPAYYDEPVHIGHVLRTAYSPFPS